MAKLNLRRSRDERGHALHPVCRVTLTLRPRSEDPTILRLTLRSDGAILRQVRLSNRWSGNSIWQTVSYGFPCHGAELDMGILLARFAERRYSDAIAMPEALPAGTIGAAR